MPGPYKGFLTQRATKQEHTKPRHQPSDRDQRARDRLRNKASAFQAKIKSPAYIALGLLFYKHSTGSHNNPSPQRK